MTINEFLKEFEEVDSNKNNNNNNNSKKYFIQLIFP
jgi:hypothetical protein